MPPQPSRAPLRPPCTPLPPLESRSHSRRTFAENLSPPNPTGASRIRPNQSLSRLQTQGRPPSVNLSRPRRTSIPALSIGAGLRVCARGEPLACFCGRGRGEPLASLGVCTLALERHFVCARPIGASFRSILSCVRSERPFVCAFLASFRSVLSCVRPLSVASFCSVFSCVRARLVTSQRPYAMLTGA